MGIVYGLVGPLARLRFRVYPDIYRQEHLSSVVYCSPGIYPGDYGRLQPVLTFIVRGLVGPSARLRFTGAFIVRNIYRHWLIIALGFNPEIT